MEYAEWEFELSIPDANGVSEKEHLQEVERQTNKTPARLIGPEFPTVLEHIWNDFIQLSNSRGQGFSGPLPLSYQEIHSWSQVCGLRLKPWHVDVIKRLDAVYMKVVAKNV